MDTVHFRCRHPVLNLDIRCHALVDVLYSANIIIQPTIVIVWNYVNMSGSLRYIFQRISQIYMHRCLLHSILLVRSQFSCRTFLAPSTQTCAGGERFMFSEFERMWNVSGNNARMGVSVMCTCALYRENSFVKW